MANRLAIFGFPSGAVAWETDKELFLTFRQQEKWVPDWLEEHMLHEFPERGLLQHVAENWTIESYGNENARFHYWLARIETHRTWRACFKALLLLIPGTLELALRFVDQEPFYRQIFVATRQSSEVL